MLVLSRRADESIRIGDDIRVTVLQIRGNQVRLGIEAPGSVPIYREELFEVASAPPEGDRRVGRPAGAAVSMN